MKIFYLIKFLIDLGIVLIYAKSVYFVLNEYPDHKFVDNLILDKILILILMNLNAFFLINLSFICFHCCKLITFIYVFITSIIFLCLNQWNQLLHQTKEIPNCLLRQFMKHHTKAVVVVLDYNKSFCTIFLSTIIESFLATIVEFNTYMQDKQKFHYLQMIQLFLATIQTIAIFGVHFMCAKYTKKIHLCSKVLTFHYKSLSTKNGRLQLTLSNYIEKFNTKNRYGFTYGKFRLIDFFSFYKVGYYKIVLNFIFKK